MAETLFTPDTANAALPLVRAIVEDLVDLESRLADLATAYRQLKARIDRPQVELNETRTQIARLVGERDACAGELTELGVRLGNAAAGICDFPAAMDGEPIFLCWEFGEDAVEHYHRRDQGYADRRPIAVACGVGSA